MATFAEVEQSIRNAALPYSYRGSGQIVTCGCLVYIDPLGKIKIRPETDDAEPERIKHALMYY